MSKQLTFASAVSVLALSALALFASVSPNGQTDAAGTIEAPAFLAEVPLD